MFSSSKDRPLVSVIIPTYKHAYLLRRAIDSVIAQSYQNWELIVIDNSSKDGSEELVLAKTTTPPAQESVAIFAAKS